MTPEKEEQKKKYQVRRNTILFTGEGTIKISQNLKFLNMMEMAGKGEVMRVKREDQREKCPKFEGNKEDYLGFKLEQL